jgi:NAD(P)-dependent dehydrogenase (short-subunit alcohol dehydrogenase family)
MDVKAWAKVLAVNLTANWRLIRSMDALLRASDAGRAIFLTSGAAANPRAFWGAYATSKAGLEAMVKAYADEVDKTPVRCALVNPGPVATRMRGEAFPGEDPTTLTQPADVAPLIVELARPDLTPPLDVVNYRDWAAQQTPLVSA